MNFEIKTYVKKNVCDFSRAQDKWGAFGNMSGGYEFNLGNVHIFNSEGLYQACRFPDYPDVQKEILSDPSGMGAKMRSKKYRKTHTRPDFDDVRIDIMRWCLQLKFVNNEVRLSKELRDTRGRDIVEFSTKDDFWGAHPNDKKDPVILTGQNVLGQLWMEIRDKVVNNEEVNIVVPPIPNFTLLGRLITYDSLYL